MEIWQIVGACVGVNLLTIIGCLLYCLWACKEVRKHKDEILYLEEALSYCEALRKAANGEDRRKKERRQ